MGNGHTTKRIGLLGLVCIVISAMLGGGVYNLPQNVATTSSAMAVIVAWVVTAVGMFFVANTFRILSEAVPDLKNGIYTYAEHGFGKLAGFFVAYGYWICNCFAMVAYGVLLPSTLNLFFPGVFGSGNNWASVAFSSAVTWVMFWLTCHGAKDSAIINVVATVCKIVPIVLFVALMASAFSPDFFVEHLWGTHGPSVTPAQFQKQVEGTMLVTLFLFMGIEGAVVVSDQARSSRDVARATAIGFAVTLAVYVLVSLVPYGVFTQGAIASTPDPSLAVLLEKRFGLWAALVANAGIVVSVLSAWLVWMVMLGQMPLFAARDGVFPPLFKGVNDKDAPVPSLLVTAVVIQVLLIAGHFIKGSAWTAMVNITAVMSLPCYLVCCLFLLKVARKGSWPMAHGRAMALATAAVGTVYSAYLVVEARLDLLVVACVVYAAGLPIYLWARLHPEGDACTALPEGAAAGWRERLRACFTPAEAVLAALVLAGAAAGIGLLTGLL